MSHRELLKRLREARRRVREYQDWADGVDDDLLAAFSDVVDSMEEENMVYGDEDIQLANDAKELVFFAAYGLACEARRRAKREIARAIEEN